MYEQTASNWAVGLYSLLDPTNFLPFLPHLWNRQAIDSRYSKDTKILDIDVLIGYLILFWVTLYLLYEKCLNSLFRRMRYPLLQRNRIVEAIWRCGFCFGSICYMMSSAIQIISLTPSKHGNTYQEIGIALHKSFFFHQAGIDIFCYSAWIKGCANLLFASFIFNPYQQNYKWCLVTSTFLMYRTIDIVIVNFCRILLCILPTVRRPLCKLLFLLHCLNWIYLYLYYVPIFMLSSKEIKYTSIKSGLWLWFAVECLDSIWFRRIRHAKASYWLEICLFPPPTQEAIELAGIYKRHKAALKKISKRTPEKVELWQTLVCAMAIKKKVRRIRQAKLKEFVTRINNINLSTEDSEEKTEETELSQTHVKNETAEK